MAVFTCFCKKNIKGGLLFISRYIKIKPPYLLGILYSTIIIITMQIKSFSIIAIAALISSLHFTAVHGQDHFVSEAHKRSAFAIIDPLYQNGKAPLDVNPDFYWLYGRSEMECWRLQVLRQRVEKARLNVNYPGKYHLPFTSVKFRLKSDAKAALQALDFKAVGHVRVLIDGKPGYTGEASEKTHHLDIPNTWENIVFELTSNEEPPALQLSEKQLAYRYGQWEWMAEDVEWQPAQWFADNGTSTPPHQLELPEKTLQAEKTDGFLYDFGREVFGRVSISSNTKPFITVGESVPEALDTTSSGFEQDVTMISQGNGKWISANPVAFRYVKVHRGNVDQMLAQIVETPVSYRGAFACSDTVLTKIWMNSAYTLRLCMQDFLLDGIKRDRLPWTGDMVMSMLVNAYTFADKEIVRRSLVALGREGIKESDINGIIDYSLWWIIAQEYYQLYYGDSLHLQQEWPKIKETFRLLQARTDKKGFLPSDDSWLFIDWVDTEKITSLQILWWWAQQSALKLAERAGDKQFISSLENLSDHLKANLYQLAWNKKGNYWQGTPAPGSQPSRHASFLSVISGLAEKSQYEAIRNTLTGKEADPVGTPYMAGFELMGLNRVGGNASLFEGLKSVWGEMLNLGATTFWEAYDSKNKGKEHYAFYGRPYAKSLCHAWGTGPAALLPSEILNIKPLETGWTKFSIDPSPGNLKWIVATVPTPLGDIEVEIEEGIMQLKVPAGAKAYFQNTEYQGPQTVSLKLGK